MTYLSYSSDNARSLSTRPQGNSGGKKFKIYKIRSSLCGAVNYRSCDVSAVAQAQSSAQYNGLRFWRCRSCVVHHSCGWDSIPDPGTSIHYGYGQKKKKSFNKKIKYIKYPNSQRKLTISKQNYQKVKKKSNRAVYRILYYHIKKMTAFSSRSDTMRFFSHHCCYRCL